MISLRRHHGHGPWQYTSTTWSIFTSLNSSRLGTLGTLGSSASLPWWLVLKTFGELLRPPITLTNSLITSNLHITEKHWLSNQYSILAVNKETLHTVSAAEMTKKSIIGEMFWSALCPQSNLWQFDVCIRWIKQNAWQVTQSHDENILGFCYLFNALRCRRDISTCVVARWNFLKRSKTHYFRTKTHKTQKMLIIRQND